jgi:hypothetical protein
VTTVTSAAAAAPPLLHRRCCSVGAVSGGGGLYTVGVLGASVVDTLFDGNVAAQGGERSSSIMWPIHIVCARVRCSSHMHDHAVHRECVR